MITIGQWTINDNGEIFCSRCHRVVLKYDLHDLHYCWYKLPLTMTQASIKIPQFVLLLSRALQ